MSIVLALLLADPAIVGERYDDPVSRGFVGPTRPALAGPHTIYVNFDGVTLEVDGWTDDATKNRTLFPDFGGEWPAFGDAPGSAKREAVLAAVRNDFDRFGVVVTDERPASGLYTMAIVSPRGGGTQQLGVANVACGGSNLAGLAFAFFGASEGDTTKIAATVSHEVGHSLGLDHTSDTADLMFPTNQGGDPSLVDACVGLEAGALCTAVHAEFCGTGQQNGVAELTALLGTGEVDTEGPMLEIVSPTDGDRFALGTSVTIEVEATDDVGVEQVKLYRGDTLVGTDIEAPYEWTLDGLEEGVVELRAEGVDVAGQHSESDVVAIAIGDAELPDADDDDSDDGGALTIGDTLDEAPDDDRTEGCGCTQDRRGSPLFLLALVALTRVRASARDPRA